MNNGSALKNSEFVRETILEILRSGRIVETHSANTTPTVVNPLTVSVNASDKLDFRDSDVSSALSANHLIYIITHTHARTHSHCICPNNRSYPLTGILQWYINLYSMKPMHLQKPISTLEKEQSKSCPSCMWHCYMTWHVSLPNIFKSLPNIFKLS